jgi:hypothetical protein
VRKTVRSRWKSSKSSSVDRRQRIQKMQAADFGAKFECATLAAKISDFLASITIEPVIFLSTLGWCRF